MGYNGGMLSATFDTLKYYRRLEAGGFSRDQAEVAVEVQQEVIRESLEAYTKELATKNDLNAVKQELRGDIAELRQEIHAVKQELKGDISELRQEIYAVKQELKGDIAELRQELKSDNANLKEELKNDNAKLKEELKSDNIKLKDEIAAVKVDIAVLKWMMGMVISGVLALVLKAFFM